MGTQSNKTLSDHQEFKPLRGIELLAWWSVPTVAIVAISCAASLAYFYMNAAAPDNAVAIIESPDASDDPVGTEFSKITVKPVALKPNPATGAVEVKDVQTKKSAVDSPIIASLRCNPETQAIEFSGDGQINFSPASPSLEMDSLDSTSPEAWLVFDGTNQAIELPPIPKSRGTVSMIVKIPDGKDTSIFFDSSLQRLTVRKNDDGLRWRVAAKRKAAKIRLLDQQVDFSQWHHLVLTWSDGDQAILYLDGAFADRHDYQNEQPQSPNFTKVILGKTRGPNGNYYQCKIAEVNVFRDVKTAAEVATHFKQAKSNHPLLFPATN